MSINSITGNTLLTSGSFPPARVATTGANINLQTIGLGTIDGVQLVAGDRVLVKDQTDATTNGIYAASTGTWVRTTDAAGNSQFFSGMAVTVALGAVNAGLTYICTTTDDPVIVGTSLITFAAQSTVATATQSATSATSFTIGTGSKTFTTQAGKAFAVNQWALINETSNSANQMLGQITAYSGTSLTVNVTATGGSGTHADWTIVLTNSAAAAGLQPPVGSGNVTGPGSATAGHIATFADGTGKVLSDGGAAFGGANTITPSMFANAAVAFGVGMLNGTLVASVAGSALTIAVKTLAGADPSPGDPVFFLFRDASAGFAVIEQTAALSITVPSTATLGTVNGQTNRIWVGVFNNGGAAVLGVYNAAAVSATTPSIVCWDETSPASAAAVVAGSNSAQLWFAASLISSKVFRVLGYVESTQATAGTWVTSPSNVQLFGPGIKRPGEPVKTINVLNSTNQSTTSATFVVFSASEITVSMSSAANAVSLTVNGTIAISSSQTGALKLSRGTANNTNMIGNNTGFTPGVASTPTFPTSCMAFDFPNVTGNQTYAAQLLIAGGATLSFPQSGNSVWLQAQEISA